MNHVFKSILFPLLIAIITFPSIGQTQHQQFLCSHQLFMADVENDKQGNLYIELFFNGSLTIGGLVFNSTTVTGGVNFLDVVIAKFNKNGEFIWAKNLGMVEGFTEYFNRMEVTNDGDIYFSNNNTPGQTILGQYFSQKPFFGKLDTDGNLKWLKSAYSPDFYTYGMGINKDTLFIHYHSNSNFILDGVSIAGENTSSNSLGFNNNGTYLGKPHNIFSSANDICGKKYNIVPSILKPLISILGNNLYAYYSYFNSNVFLPYVDLAANSYISGYYSAPVIVSINGVAVSKNIPNGHNNLYIMKTNTDGNIVWFKDMSGSYYTDNYFRLSMDAENNIFAVSNIKYGTTIGGIKILPMEGNSDIYYQKMDLDGNELETKIFNGATERATSIQVNKDGKIWILGTSTPIYSTLLGTNVFTTIAGIVLNKNNSTLTSGFLIQIGTTTEQTTTLCGIPDTPSIPGINTNTGNNTLAGISRQSIENFQIYPNPSNGSVHISGAETDSHIIIYSYSGIKIKELEIENEIEEINLFSGFYIFEIQDKNNLRKHIKVRIE